MMSGAATIEFEGRRTWPKDAKLFQLNEEKQMLLPEFALCLGVKAYLKMSGLQFEIDERQNAEFMSPTGKIPFMKIDRALVSDVRPIMEYITNRGHNLNEHLHEPQIVELKAYTSLLEKLHYAESYVTWQDKTMYDNVTWFRYGEVYPFPLNYVLPYMKKSKVLGMLRAVNWNTKSLKEVESEVETVCQALSEKLGKKKYFFGDRPSELDAMVYGHLYCMLKIKLPVDIFSRTVKSFNNLSSFCDRIHKKYFE